MGTRAGDHDPAIGYYILEKEGIEPKEVERTLNKGSGVLGITETFTDRRDVENAAREGNKRAALAIEIEDYRLKKYIGAYYAALGHVDAVVFTAGVGERGSTIRGKSVSGLEAMGIKLDAQRNEVSKTRNTETMISTPDSPVKIFVIPTDEELVMTEDTYALLQGNYQVHTGFTYSFQSPGYRNKERDEALTGELNDKPELKKIIAPIP